VVRVTFTVGDFHLILLAGLPTHCGAISDPGAGGALNTNGSPAAERSAASPADPIVRLVAAETPHPVNRTNMSIRRATVPKIVSRCFAAGATLSFILIFPALSHRRDRRRAQSRT
jgi:hypothetical protein